jgi:serine/threonine-protein kinase
MAPALAVGQVIGSYGIVRKIGAGGMGEIYEVSHSRLSGRYAMKVLRAEAAAASEPLMRFQREAKVTSALRHPNIVQVIDFSTTEGGQPYLVMEFLNGPELAQVMKGSTPLPLPRIVSYVKQIASGLIAAHEHDVVHRDLKPQNIFVLKVAGIDQEVVKIVDFGISKISAVTATITSASTVIGTAQYMSPEQALGRIEQIDARTDQFSLALIVYEMLTGETAFRGESVSSLVYQIVHEEPRHLVDPNGPIPPAMAAVLKRAIAKDKERRFPTVKAFAEAFEGAATASADVSATTMASQRSVLDAGVRIAAPSRRGLRLGVGLAGLAVAGVAIGVLLLRGEPRKADEPHTSTPAPGPVPATRQAAPEVVPPPAMSPKDPAPVAAVATMTPEAMKRDPTKSTRRLKQEPPKPAPAPPSPPASTPPKANCSPNYYVDSQGDKHFKPECFQ